MKGAKANECEEDSITEASKQRTKKKFGLHCRFSSTAQICMHHNETYDLQRQLASAQTTITHFIATVHLLYTLYRDEHFYWNSISYTNDKFCSTMNATWPCSLHPAPSLLFFLSRYSLFSLGFNSFALFTGSHVSMELVEKSQFF